MTGVGCLTRFGKRSVHREGILSEINKEGGGLRAGDLFGLRVISEEGLLLGRICDQSCRSQDGAAALTLGASPLISLIEHDAIRFLNEKLKMRLVPEPFWIARMRYLTKSLNSHLEYSEYSRQANAIIEQLGIRFKTIQGSWLDLKIRFSQTSQWFILRVFLCVRTTLLPIF